jgi:Protein of unknown function (DUF3606)
VISKKQHVGTDQRLSLFRHQFGGGFMSDDKTNRGIQDRTRINVHEDYELRDWSKRLGVTPDELKKAVQQVGTSADAVRKHLGK